MNFTIIGKSKCQQKMFLGNGIDFYLFLSI